MTRKRERFEKAVASKRDDLVGYGIKARVRRDDAEDLAQDVMVFALRHAGWENVSDVGAWMYHIWRNKAESRRKNIAQRLNALERAIADGAFDEAEPDKGLSEIDQDLYDAVLQSIDRAGLSGQQHVFFCARATGKSNAEIAGELGISADSVRATFSAAVQKIRAMLGAEKGMGEGK